jgi:DNA-binding MarR family transcriptional regulator
VSEAATAEGERTERLTALGKAFKHAFRSLRSMRGRDTHLVAGEIGHAQFELLADMNERGALSASELAAAAGLSAATVSQMLDHLAESGHVERVRSESDRRIVVSKLTRRGRSQVEKRRALWRGRWEEALDGVDEDELRIATEVLERIGGVFADQAKKSK